VDEEPSGPSIPIHNSHPVESTVRRACAMLATALAMLEVVHLLVIKRFNDRFLSFALAQPLDSTLRAPSLAEILAADRAVWESVWALIRDHGWSLSDSLNEIAFCRQDISSALQPRPRPPAPVRPPLTLQPRLPHAPDAGKKRKPTAESPSPAVAKGAPKAKAKADPKARPSPKKKTIADKWDPSWATHIDGHELCKKFGLGKCKSKNCRFAPSGHRCPVPDAAGNPCGQEHSAVEHLAAGH